MTGLLLRADAGPRLGVGHLARCVALAEQATARGCRVAISGTLAAGHWLVERLAELRVPVLPAAGDAAAIARAAAAWGADVVLVDHYGLGRDLWPAIRTAGARLVSMEDGEFGRRSADVVVDCGFGATSRPDDGSPVVLTGPRFAPLRAAVHAARWYRAQPADQGEPVRRRPRVVLALGGGDTRAALAAALTAVRDTGLPVEALAVSAMPIDPPDARTGQSFTVDGPRVDLPALFAGADLVVSAAGVTLLELCCVAVPTALVLLADNQAELYRAVVAHGLAAGLGTAGELTTGTGPATRVITGLLTDPARQTALHAAMSGLVDGHGAARILDAAGITGSYR